MRTDVPLAPFTTLRLGGPARTLLTAYDEGELVEHAGAATLLLGGGSNVVVADAGVDGLAVLVRTSGVRIQRDGERALVTVAAGEDWDALVARTVAEGLAGMEALAGIPGSVGASPVQNIGAYGQDVAQTVTSVRALDRRTGEVRVLSAAECGFGYRHSAFKAEPARWLVLEVTFALAVRDTGAPVRYAELARSLGVELGGTAPIGQVRDAVLALRRGKGMVLDEADPDSRSAGSFFTNPVLSPAQADDVRSRLGALPGHVDADGATKVSAAWLIERAGFRKGWGDGPVGLSTKHVLALVHRGGGTTEDLLAVARAVRDGVRDATGLVLVPEPVLVGPIAL